MVIVNAKHPAENYLKQNLVIINKKISNNS